MGFYNGTAMELLCQQVIRDNPSMAGRLTPDAVTVNGTAVARNANGRNTQITFVGIPGKGFHGELTLSYDRINLTTFTGGLYVPVEIAASAVTYADALPQLNELLGLNLSRDDLATPDAVFTGGIFPVNITIAVKSGSFCYTGALRLTWQRQPSMYYPESGPGPTGLRVGDEQAGYFGVVPAAEMFTAQALVNAIMAGTGVDVTVTATARDWMKFFFRGKVLFIPKMNMPGTSWDNYYKAGSAYGSDDPNGPLYPGTDKVVVEQNKIISNVVKGKAHYFHHRLPRGSTSILQAVSLTGEDYGLVAKVLGGEWGQETGTNIGGNTYFISQHIYNLSQPEYCSIFSMDGKYFNAGVAKANTYNYVPVLEYVNPNDVLLPLTDITGRYNMVVKPATVESVPLTSELVPIVPLAPMTTKLTSAPTTVSNEDRLLPIAPLYVSTLHLTPAPVTVTLRKPGTKTALNDTNGVLGDFK
ncbi:putative virion structural protein [Erwinia phage vB_EamM_Kwan]|uniref:Putative virion structural protein n=1 Tax=Erwinia phage vB_EamM_Kwan TaxID=1883374 RepID=A0A1B2IE26_9CAUD|nr:virion structural protein [Erwinia phage vB_EamM_Kwan]ANZ49521.1 putative virion structural protein [Erwinia phage vB_EamM_Kwan]